jgi:cytochrome c oxidase assembly factor 2
MTMDSDRQRRIRKRRRISTDSSDEAGGSEHTQEIDDEIARFREMKEEAERMAKIRRECPVPKPGGVIGEILGFKSRGDNNGRDGVPRADIPGRESER